MQRTIDAVTVFHRSMRVSESSTRPLSYTRNRAQRLRIYSVGTQGLEEVLTKLPDLFLRGDCKTIKSEKKVVVGRLSLQIGDKFTGVYLKQHNVLSVGHRLASIFCASAARRSLSSASVLQRLGYATAQPIAAAEYRVWGVLIKSLYLSEEIAGAKTVATFWREDLVPIKSREGRVKRRAFLKRLARLFESLHKNKIYHNDLKAPNILVINAKKDAEEILSLIDLQGLRKCFYVSKRRKIKNLAQLNRTLGVYLSRTEKLFFFNAYADSRFGDRKRKKPLIASIVQETTRQVLRERSRHESMDADPTRRVAAAADGLGRKHNGKKFDGSG